jgi:phage terminase large subunit-like protein
LTDDERLNLSVPDWEDRIRTGRSLLPQTVRVINPPQWHRAVSIFRKLRLPDVPGNPTMAEACGVWFLDIVGALLGAIDPISAQRVVRELLLLTPKKNSKTTYGAGLMITALLLNRRPRAEFLFIAPTQLISDLAFDAASGMIEIDEAGFLQKRLKVQGHLKAITERKRGATLKVKSFNPKVLTGVKPAGVLLDELHEISKSAMAARVIGQIRGGLLPYPEGFLAMISTQSDEPPAGAFKAELQLARAIRDGKSKGALLPVIYEFPREIMADKAKPAAWQDPTVWPMVLPNLGRSVTIDRLREEYAAAVEKGEAELRRWASQHLNIEIGVALASDRWPGTDYWRAQADPTLTLDTLLDRSEVVLVGIDGGGLEDMLGLTVMGREAGTRRWLTWSKAWIFAPVLERYQSEAARWQDFAAQGDLVIADVLGEDVAQLADLVKFIADSGLFPIGDKGEERPAIAVDPAGIGQVIDKLVAREINSEIIVGISQGWRLAGSILTTERKLADGTLVHADQPLMDWCVGNAKVELHGSAVYITKQISGRAKIDPLMALFDAGSLMSRNPEAGGEAGAIYIPSGDDREGLGVG